MVIVVRIGSKVDLGDSVLNSLSLTDLLILCSRWVPIIMWVY